MAKCENEYTHLCTTVKEKPSPLLHMINYCIAHFESHTNATSAFMESFVFRAVLMPPAFYSPIINLIGNLILSEY